MRMRWCRDCGGYIEFRALDGRSGDLPQCCCFDEAPGNTTPDDIRSGFCQLTSCPLCHSPVFFLRHNAGRIWFDEIRWPWPKHRCFDSPLHALLQSIEGFDAVHLGIVLSVGESGQFLARLEDGREMHYAVAHPPPAEKLAGTLLVISREDLQILFPPDLKRAQHHAHARDNKIHRHGNHPLPGTNRRRADGSPLISCAFCSATFSTEQEKGEHLKNHPDCPCPYCSYTTLLRDELDSHIKNRHPARLE